MPKSLAMMLSLAKSCFLLVFLFVFVPTPCLQSVEDGSCKIINLDVFVSKYIAIIDCSIKVPINDGWTMQIDFDKPATNFETWNVELTKRNEEDLNIELQNRLHDAKLKAGDHLRVLFTAGYMGALSVGSVILTPKPSPLAVSTTPPPDTSDCVPPASYNYSEVIDKSILFYEAQRSGKLPIDNRIPWRGDSGLMDGYDVYTDLTGGWHDAGDHLKLNFPMAYSVTVLAWGFLEYRDAYEAANEVKNFRDSIKWALDYLIKCHPSKYEYYFQVGRGGPDHSYWGTPEAMTMERPAYKVTKENPGSDVVGETAAAMAASSLVFREVDPEYADTLVMHAKELYDFAKEYNGTYDTQYYKSTFYGDELVWAQVWLYLATNETFYLDAAIDDYANYNLGGGDFAFGWASKKIGVKVHMCRLRGTQNPRYCNSLVKFLDGWMVGGTAVEYTPGGLAFRAEWGSLRYAAATSFIALLTADLGYNPEVYREFAKKQLHYILGDTCRSFVVGYGVNPPKNPHHRSSSCPSPPNPCTWDTYNTAPINAHTLTGALIGGPSSDDSFLDERQDYIHSEVACDYNAGFQSAIAGLKHLELAGML